MTRRSDLTLAAHLAMWVTLAALVFLAVCYARGFDPAMCEAYQACGWRHA